MCLSPISIKLPDTCVSATYRRLTGQINRLSRQLVPCGHCLECLKAYQNSWKVRLIEESKMHKYCHFVTLTYNEKSVPIHKHCIEVPCQGSEGDNFTLLDEVKVRVVCKEDVQKWLKRGRTNLSRQFGKEIRFRYFCTSEYGPRTFRPHYHLLIFGLTPVEMSVMCNDWRNKYGFVSVSQFAGQASGKVAEYVSKYCSKGQFESPYVREGLAPKTFHLSSKSIGLSYVERMKRFHLETLVRSHKKGKLYTPFSLEQTVNRRFYFYCPDGDKTFNYKLPRYYVNKIFDHDSKHKSFLSCEMSDFLLAKLNQLRDEKLAELRAQYPAWSYGKALFELESQEWQAAVQRESDIRASMMKYYNKSKL